MLDSVIDLWVTRESSILRCSLQQEIDCPNSLYGNHKVRELATFDCRNYGSVSELQLILVCLRCISRETYQ